MPDLTPLVIECQMFEDDTQYLGVAQVTLPSVQHITQDVSGSGIMGEVSIPVLDQLQAMQIQIQFHALAAQIVPLAAPRVHTWTFKEIQQTVDGINRTQGMRGVKHLIRAFPTSVEGGTLQNHSQSNPTITATVYYWARYVGGQKDLEIDPFSYIYRIGDTDYAANLRNAINND